MPLSLWMTVALSPVPECTAMETFLCLYHLKHLRGRKHIEEFLVVGLLYLFHFQFRSITALNQFTAGSIVDGLNKAFLSHLLKDGPLLLLHLTVQREELRTLVGSKPCLLGDKLLHLCLELLRRELPASFLSR